MTFYGFLLALSIIPVYIRGMEFILPFNASWLWFALAVLFVIIEGFTLALTTVWFAVGALILVFVSFAPIPFLYQILLFLGISIALLLLTRPVALKKLKLRQEKTNVDRFIGMSAIVTRKITTFDKGEIKAGGIFWTARTEDETPLESATECVIQRIEGVTAIVALKKEAVIIEDKNGNCKSSG